MADPQSFHRLVRINNKNRVSGTPNNFTCDFTDDPKTHKVSEVHIHTITMPHVFYNINSYNKTLKITLGLSGLQTITLTEGWYTTALMITELQNAINPLLGGGSSLTITQNVLTGKLEFDITVGTDTITFVSNVTDPTSTLSPYIGIVSGGVASLGNPYEAEEHNNLIGVQNVFIESSTINSGKTLLSASGTINNTFANVPVTVPYKGNIVYKSNETDFNDRFVYSIVKDISTIDIKLKDGDGNLLHLGSNHEFIITLKVFYVP